MPESITPSESPTLIKLLVRETKTIVGSGYLTKFLHSLLPDMKSVTAKQKHMFKIGALSLMDELLVDTGSGQQSSTGLSETSTFYHMASLQEAQDSFQSVLTCWETE
jgi:hypothetical protein